MGTSGSYKGSGGKFGRAIRDAVGDWLDSLPNGDPTQPPKPEDSPSIRPEVLLPVISLMKPISVSSSRGSGDGGGAGGGGSDQTSGRGRSGGGPQRSVRASARSAGRAAAAAYAYRVGDSDSLARLGLDYQELSSLRDPIEVTRRIVDAACGSQGDGTIEEHEQRYVAAEIAEWVLEQPQEMTPSPEEIVRKTIALIIAEVFFTETGELLRNGERPEWASELAEAQVRDAAEILAQRASFSVEGVTDSEFSRAIEDGVETLRRITGSKAR